VKALVVGATGNQGSAVVRHALRAGLEVNGLVRDPESPRAVGLSRLGVTLRPGDLDRPETLASAFEGMDAVFSVQNFWRTGNLVEFFQGRAVVEAALEARIGLFVQTTGGLTPGCGSANTEVKAIIEALVREAFPDAFILRPVWFIDGLNLTSFNLEDATLEFMTAPDQPHAWVAIDDIGKMVARAFTDFDSVAGLTMNFASRVNTATEMVGAFNRVLGTSLRYHHFSDDELAAKIRSLASEPLYIHELEGIFGAIRTTNFSVDLALHDRLLPDRHTLDSWTREFAYPLWHERLTG
jgi:uncharacterized protein YbjT (DUF2867 family)